MHSISSVSRSPIVDTRPSGLPLVGRVPWGAHLCQFYRTKDDLADLLVPYFEAGLASGEQCMWVASEPMSAAECRDALRRAVPDLDERMRCGQIEILDQADWYTRSGSVDPQGVLRAWMTLEQQALDRGYAGLRISGNTFWLERDDWAAFADYEAEVHRAFHTRKIIALCSYSLERCQANEIIDVLRNHRFALVRRDGSWEIIRNATLMLAEMNGALHGPELHPDRAHARDGTGSQRPRAARLAEATARPPDHLLTELEHKTRALEAEVSLRQQLESERSQLFASEREARAGAQVVAEHLGRLQRVTSALSEAATHADIARVAVTDLAAVLGADKAILAVPVENGQELLLLGHAGLQPETLQAFGVFPVDSHLPVATAYRSGQRVWLPSAQAIEEQYPDLKDLSTSQAILCEPLTVAGQRLGAIGLGFCAPRRFEATERALVDDLVKQVALALERARLYEEAKQAGERWQLLADTAAWVSLAKLDLAQVLDSIVREVTRDFADSCAIHLLASGSKTFELAALRHEDPDIEASLRQLLTRAPLELGRGFAGAVVESGRPLRLISVSADDIANLKPEHREHIARHPLTSLLMVPLHSGHECLGVLVVGRNRVALPFTADDERLVQDLGNRVALAIDNARLYERAQAERRRAEDANRAKDEFLAMLGHELRNPLSPILTALQLMKLRGGDQLLKERVIIERQAHHMVRLVDDLLDMSRITRGKVELARGPIDLAEVVSDAIEQASPVLEQRAHTLRTEVPAGLVVHGDAHRLAQVIANLLTNAGKYTPPGGTIEVCARHPDDLPDDTVELAVRDNGVGIEPELLPQVFDLFVQGRQSLDRSKGGLGLGLALVRALVERHGGTVHAHSEGRDQGSEFTIRLPRRAHLRAEPDSPASEAAARTDPPPARPRATTPRRILLVDDNRDAAHGLEELLRAAGHITRVAHDGPSALDIAEEFRPEIALLDIGLPVMDGYELGRRLLELLADAPPKLVAVTGYGQRSDRARSRAAGFADHLVKPIDLDRLEPALARLFQAKRVRVAQARGEEDQASPA